MSSFEVDDRVLLMEDQPDGTFSTIPAGTEGIVMETPGMFGTSYRIRFDNGSEAWVSGDCLGAGSDPRNH
jgi:hypothetical protein